MSGPEPYYSDELESSAQEYRHIPLECLNNTPRQCGHTTGACRNLCERPDMDNVTSSLCACNCGGTPSPGRKFITGHNLRALERTKEHRRKISEGQKRAWTKEGRRFPLGATRLDSHGYIVVKARVGYGRWDKQHVLAVEDAIGRKLTPGEQVHHINGIRTDNRLENLLLCEDSSDHHTVEGTFKRLLPDLLASGAVVFDRAERRYRLG